MLASFRELIKMQVPKPGAHNPHSVESGVGPRTTSQTSRVTTVWATQDLTLKNTNPTGFWMFTASHRNQILPPGSVVEQKCSSDGGDWRSEILHSGKKRKVQLCGLNIRTIATLSNTAKGSDKSGENDLGDERRSQSPCWSFEYYRDSAENREAFLHHLTM